MDGLETIREGTILAPGLTGREVPFESIPVIDLAPFLDGRGKTAVAEAIGRACREVGFFYVKNHGIPRARVEAAFAAARCFFDLALEMPPEDPDVIAGKPFHGPNVWPEGLPGFRDAAYGYYLAARTLSRRIAGAVALSLGLPEDHFADKLDRPIASLRLIHYPPQSGAIEADTIGCGAHRDYGFLTVLAQDEVGGLQLRNGAGEWIAAPPIPGAFVINVSELLERWTNGLYKATLHRVINTSGRDRYAMPFFLDTNYDAVIACLAVCQSPDHPPKYPPVVGGEYLFRRYDETFAYRKGLDPAPGKSR